MIPVGANVIVNGATFEYPRPTRDPVNLTEISLRGLRILPSRSSQRKTERFDRAEAERISRQTKTGKLFIDTQTKETALATKFYMPRQEKKFEDPFKQAEYIYSLIEVEK